MTQLLNIPVFLLTIFALWEIEIVIGCSLQMRPSWLIKVPIGGSGYARCDAIECGREPILPYWEGSYTNDRLVFMSYRPGYAEFRFKNMTKDDFKVYKCSAWSMGKKIVTWLKISEEPWWFRMF